MIRKALAGAVTLVMMVGGCATMKPGEDQIVQAPKVCRDISFPIYFRANTSAMTPDGRRLIADAAARAKPCRVVGIRVVGLADASGGSAENLSLSGDRATSVVVALGKAGLPTDGIDVRSAGEAGAVDSGGLLRPVRRRADITLKLSPP